MSNIFCDICNKGNKMTNKKKNIKLIEFRKSLGLNQTEFAKVLNQPQSLVAMIETGARKAPQSFKDAIFKTYKFQLPEDEEVKNTETKLPDTIVSIPIYEISASAGTGTLLDKEPEQNVMYFDKRCLKQRLKTDDFSNLHIIHAKGDSMDSGWNQPDDIKDGDLLMIDTSQTTGNNQIFVILVNNQELRVKRLAKRGDSLYVISNNPNYKEEVYNPNSSDTEIKVIGRVVWNDSKENL